MGDERPQGTEPVELYAKTFGWCCPDCDTENTEEYCVSIVTCEKCRKSFYSLQPEAEFEEY
jgi:ribosomal protein L37AE/L43A